ncbi:hypothetical protein Dsin_022151 [Dipteronia sinensis]|uniref:Uncharacterized protein n=1 Tax=Dipteronia sinensis TaxID=43782 RepID=A0AAE0A2A6_9ROSI|nr:hypothetical protein Dsin_022151 [Dipteronia sinensis]
MTKLRKTMLKRWWLLRSSLRRSSSKSPFLFSLDLPDGSVSGFFKNAVNKIQTAHSSLDDHLARWFGLNQSKYQWALDDYYESKGLEKQNKYQAKYRAFNMLVGLNLHQLKT